MLKDKWIWLDKELYPNNQKNPHTGNWDSSCEDGTVVEFSRRLDFGKAIDHVDIRYSADALIQLWVNGRFLGTGPVWIGGDFLANDRPRTNRYATELTCLASGEDDFLEKGLVVGDLERGRLDFLARVRLSAVQICEFSVGQGGFMLSADVFFTDGSATSIQADEEWNAVVCHAYATPGHYDARLGRSAPSRPTEIEDIWHAVTSPLPLRVEQRKLPIGSNTVTLDAGESAEITLEYDKIYAGYVSVIAKTRGEVSVELTITESPEDAVAKRESMVFVGDDEYLGSKMYSFGTLTAKITNASDAVARIDIAINEAYLPSSISANTTTSDPMLNKILDVSRHTLKYCRQYIHLDSPKHCEPMACTGDYFIETMMSSFSYGDMTLADFDVVRTARILEHNDGVMFHPTYSLIWVRMMLEVYLRTGRIGMLEDCRHALDLLLKTFDSYVGNDGIIDTPPNYMFVDWIYIDGISLHHPPKALGQSVMNMFYYDALCAASEIYAYLDDEASAKRCCKSAESLKKSINTHLYDKECGLYFEGLNTDTPKELLYFYMPENTAKRYYRINANALAAAFGVIDGEDARRLMQRVLDDLNFDDYQPYFAHFVLRAVHKTGLDEKYLAKILDKWRAPIEACDKGLAEGFIAPEPGYVFDHSHAWGGTPLYSLPMALTSLSIEEPGMKRISLYPSLLWLDHAHVEIPTPHGIVSVDMQKGNAPIINAPSGVEVKMRTADKY